MPDDHPELPPPGSGLTEAERALLAESGFDLRWLDNAPREDLDAAVARALLEVYASGLSLAVAAQRTGRSEAELLRAATATPQRLLALNGESGWRFLPLQFLDENGVVPGLERVLEVLDPSLHVLEVCRWLSLPEPNLESEGEDAPPLTPLQWLAEGRDIETVVELARDLAYPM